MLETIGSQLSPGAGRVFDVMWPVPMQKIFGGATTNQMAFRTNAWFLTNTPTWTITRTGVGTSETSKIVNGATVSEFNAGAGAFGTGQLYASGDTLGFKPRLAKSSGLPPACDDLACTRLLFAAMFPSTPAADVDYGFQVTCGADDTSPLIIANNVGGIGWNKMASGSVALIIQGAGFNTFPINTPGFDATVLHCYELRIISATAQTDAVCKAYIDNQLFQVFSWGAGSILPLVNTNYPQFKTCIVNHVGGNVKMQVYQFRMQQAPTEVGVV